MIVDHGVKPNKEVGPNLVNWANSGPCIKTILCPIKHNGHDGLSGTFAKFVMLYNDFVFIV